MDGGGTQKTLWIIANWKSNKSIAEGLDWISKVGPRIERRTHLKVVVCPEIVALEEIKKAVLVGHYPLIVGVQDLSPFEQGAHTGEEAAKSLSGLAEISILGHSERRSQLKETDQLVAEKVAQAIEHSITPLLCVQGKETPVPQGVKLIAYEPIFAIGTGNPDSPENADSIAKYFKDQVEGIEVLYGGSVTHENVLNFCQMENINGVLVGQSSLDPEEFIKIVENCYVI